MRRTYFLSLYFLALFMLVSSCSTTKKSQQNSQPVVSIEFNADSAYTFCAAQCSFGPRTMNSQAHEQCSQWIQQQFRQYGYQVALQQADLKGYDGTILKSTNIIASSKVKGDVPRIMLCAHWDSRPWSDNDPDSANWRKPVMGANDGASGVAVMLEVARLMSLHDSARVAVDFICFDAEDWGVPQWEDDIDGDSWALGAQYWAEHYKEQNVSYQYGILLDMVGGQSAKFYREGLSIRYANQIVDKVWQAASAAGYGSYFLNDISGQITDDHLPVNEKAGIPCIDIINHYPDCVQSSFGSTWHTVNDDMQHIDKNTLQAVGQTLIQLIYSD